MGKAPLTPFERDLADFLGEAPAGAAREPTRDHVTFRAVEAATPLEAAEDLVRHVRARNKTKSHLAHETRMKARAHTSYSGAVTVRLTWQGDRFHTVRFSAADGGRLLASHKVAGGDDLSRVLHDWLVAADRFEGACWRTAEEWALGAAGRSAPV